MLIVPKIFAFIIRFIERSYTLLSSMIQGHMDMVAVKEPDADLDMTKDGLRLGIDGDYVYARDTSLGYTYVNFFG